MDDILQRNKVFLTKCKDCVFNIKDELVQIGCKFNRLEKYKEQNKAELLEGEDSYTIKTICNRCRDHNSKEKTELDDEKYFEVIEKQTRCNLEYVIYYDKESTIEGLNQTIDSILNQSLKYSVIRIVIENNIDANQINNIVKNRNIKYNIHQMIITKRNRENMDFSIKKISSQYYTICKSGYIFYKDFNKKINDLLNEKLEYFSMIKAEEDFNGLVVQTYLHHILYGNINADIEEKIFVLAKEQDNLSMIKEWEDIHG